ncbi:MAG: sigma factor-like helix-turn-helix DNA-binding protein [Microcystis sp. LE19-84.1B]|jgi:DNA-binding PadR family transcriptional regulator|uniref:sigma factor-like helix-turn-helix DNA-binding protein n=1 Tax=Microcystis sp. LE19-84.1B TaxID=3016438 RepID=UPI0022C50E78|nr:sigma factor-like helix-turn-helix DNA-binding protein [Microcystis sp. LE19-84.1B]MCZ8225807.1 sigma factor-like helix-turn-helix DNA-binding protein [Microcystis sp. LE19-84.1B]
MIIPINKNEEFQHLEEMIANLQAKQKQILKGMLDYPIEIDSAIRILSEPSRQLATTANNLTRLHKILKELEKQGLVSFHDSQYSLTELGREIVGHLSNKSPTPRRDAQRKEKLQKSYDFLELHRQGLSYQQIGDKYGISRERVRQILASNPEFEAYQQKQKKNNYR